MAKNKNTELVEGEVVLEAPKVKLGGKEYDPALVTKMEDCIEETNNWYMLNGYEKFFSEDPGAEDGKLVVYQEKLRWYYPGRNKDFNTETKWKTEEFLEPDFDIDDPDSIEENPRKIIYSIMLDYVDPEHVRDWIFVDQTKPLKQFTVFLADCPLILHGEDVEPGGRYNWDEASTEIFLPLARESSIFYCEPTEVNVGDFMEATMYLEAVKDVEGFDTYYLDGFEDKFVFTDILTGKDVTNKFKFANYDDRKGRYTFDIDTSEEFEYKVELTVRHPYIEAGPGAEFKFRDTPLIKVVGQKEDNKYMECVQRNQEAVNSFLDDVPETGSFSLDGDKYTFDLENSATTNSKGVGKWKQRETSTGQTVAELFIHPISGKEDYWKNVEIETPYEIRTFTPSNCELVLGGVDVPLGGTITIENPMIKIWPDDDTVTPVEPDDTELDKITWEIVCPHGHCGLDEAKNEKKFSDALTSNEIIDLRANCRISKITRQPFIIKPQVE